MNIYAHISEIDMSELNFLSKSSKVDINFSKTIGYGIKWSATYTEDNSDNSFPLTIVGRGYTIEEALRELYWEIVSV